MTCIVSRCQRYADARCIKHFRLSRTSLGLDHGLKTRGPKRDARRRPARAIRRCGAGLLARSRARRKSYRRPGHLDLFAAGSGPGQRRLRYLRDMFTLPTTPNRSRRGAARGSRRRGNRRFAETDPSPEPEAEAGLILLTRFMPGRSFPLGTKSYSPSSESSNSGGPPHGFHLLCLLKWSGMAEEKRLSMRGGASKRGSFHERDRGGGVHC